VIREATPDDVGALAAVQSAASTLGYAGIFDAGVTPPSMERFTMRWATLIDRPRSWIGVLEEDGEVVAGIALQPSPDPDLEGQDAGEICSFYVHPRHWGERRGRGLFDQALEEADALGFRQQRLWVLEGNVRARRLYARDGWEPDGATREVEPGVREIRYRAAHSVAAINIDDVYDAETVARIDAAGAAPRPRPVGRVRQRSAAGAIAAAMMMGLREVFDPPQRSEIEQVDPWEGGGSNPWVKVHLDPDPRQTIAEVRDP